MTPSDSTQTAQATGVGSALSFTAFTVPGAVSPSQTSVVAAPATIAASTGAGASTITVTARDQYGNVIRNKAVTLAVTGNNNTLTQPSGPTGANGVASGTLSSTLAQTKTISATVGTVAIAQQATVTVTSAAADTLAWLVPPSNVAAGAHITPALQVEVRDQFGNRVTAATAGITLAIGTNPSSGALTVTPRNAVNGVATFDDASIDKAGSGYTLVASSGGLGPATSGPFNVMPAAAASLAASAGNNQTATGVAVTFATSGDNGTVDPATPVATGANGIAAANSWTLGTAAKVDTLRATAAGLSGSPVTFTATATAGGPSATQSTVAAAPATITAGVGSSTITVTVRDANGNPIQGATVTLVVSPATGSTLTQPAGTTNAGGQITGSLSSTAAGTKTVSAIVNGSVSVAQTAPVTVNPAGASASQSLVAASPATIIASSGSSASTITVTVKDANGNPVSGATVTLAASPATGVTLTQPAGTTNTSGQINGALSSTVAETKTVTALVDGRVTVTETAAVTVNSAAAATIAPHGGGGQTAPAGSAVLIAPSVLVTDAFGNPVSGVSVTFAPGPGSGSVTGATQMSDASGIATVGSWTLGPTAGQNTLMATSGSLSGSPVTFTAMGTAGAATKLVLTTAPSSSAQSGVALLQQPTVQLQDANSNPVGEAGVVITASVSPPSATPSNATATTGQDGAATFSGLTLTGTAGSYTLSFGGVSGLAPVTSGITLSAGAAAALVANSPPSQSGTAGAAVGSPPSVVIREGAENPVHGVRVTFEPTAGSGRVTGGSQATDGRATDTVGS